VSVKEPSPSLHVAAFAGWVPMGGRPACRYGRLPAPSVGRMTEVEDECREILLRWMCKGAGRVRLPESARQQ